MGYVILGAIVGYLHGITEIFFISIISINDNAKMLDIQSFLMILSTCQLGLLLYFTTWLEMQDIKISCHKRIPFDFDDFRIEFDNLPNSFCGDFS